MTAGVVEGRTRCKVRDLSNASEIGSGTGPVGRSAHTASDWPRNPDPGKHDEWKNALAA
jgi:hypothetical protein